MEPGKADSLFAHTPAEPGGEWHFLVPHLKAVADLAAGFGSKFGAEDQCRFLGLTHDLGKANPIFQKYLQNCASGAPAKSEPHAALGAAAAVHHLQDLAAVIVGHHAGLHNQPRAQNLVKEALRDSSGLEAARGLLHELINDKALSRLMVPGDKLTREFFLRMCFSALVDADFLDTETHFSGDKAGLRGNYHPISWYREALSKHLNILASKAPDTDVNRSRAEILLDCRQSAVKAPGVFRLSVPTGGGKTLSSLSFALDHAEKNGLERVIMAIPFTSIIDQTATVFADVFGEENLLEHHSAVSQDDDSEGQSSHETRRRLSAENWDVPLVVTTTVQLFESLLHNKTSKCRKLHNVAKSVIILDEAQALPVSLLKPIMSALGQLVSSYGCTVVFCTATQPNYSVLNAPVINEAIEIVTDAKKHFDKLKRVVYEPIEEELTHEEVAAMVDGNEHVLCVLNTRKDALEVLEHCRKGEDLFHLSTLLCPHHRKKVLAGIRERLKKKLPVRLVSTQVVEAGVDLDFPTVMRVVGPLDSIIQVAGRCNREGGMPELGLCFVFKLTGGRQPRGAYSTGTALAATAIKEHGARIDDLDVVSDYFQDLYRNSELDRAGTERERQSIQPLREQLDFPEVARWFKLIPDETEAVIAYNYAPREIEALLGNNYLSPRVLARKLSQYAVSVPKYQLEELVRLGFVHQHQDWLWLYTGIYDAVTGLGTGTDSDATHLIT